MTDDRRLYRVVEVRWVDSVGDSRWVDRDDALRDADDDDLLHLSCGYLLEDTDRYVLLCLSQREDGEKIGDTIQIPRECVRSMRTVSRGTAKRAKAVRVLRDPGKRTS